MTNCPELAIIPRSEWSLRNATGIMTDLALPVNYMVYTHSVTNGCSGRDSCTRIVRAIQNDHIVNRKFYDIGYNFMIGGDGSIFECRGWQKRGSFKVEFNSNGIGTGFVGNFTTEEQVESTLTFAAANSAHDLCRCAERNGYVRNCSIVSIASYNAHPALNGYVLDPERLRPQAGTTAPATKTSGLTAATASLETNSVTNATSATTTSSAENATAPQGPAQSVFSAGEIAGISVGIIAFVLMITFLVFLFCRRNTRKTKDYRAAVQKLVSPNVVAYYERPRWSIDLKSIRLGGGQHGQVYNGALMDKKPQKPRYQTMSGCRPVAIKILHDSQCGYQETADFLTEMSILMKVGRHVNIVNLEAVVLEGKLMMVMEHCELGSLDTYLHTLKANSEHWPDPATVGRPVLSGKTKQRQQSHERIVTDVMELVNISHQISRGMEYLSAKGIIHRDLAARNILLTGDKTAKIADFGMAREQPEYILERDKVPLPICWMAPESVIPSRGIFTTLSDVWSFGVVLWEIFSLGDIPYAAEFPKGISHSQLCIFLQEGHRLQAPKLCPEYVEQVMMQCWKFCPEERPNFAGIKEELECLLPATERAKYIVCDTENETLSRTLLCTVNEVH